MKPSITAGLAVGLATGLWMFAEYALGLHDDPAGAGRWTGFLALLFPVIGAYWLVKRSPPTGWRGALREGGLFGAIGGLVGGAAIFVYYARVNPGFRPDGPSGQPVQPAEQAVSGVIGALVVGTLLTLLMSATVGSRLRGKGAAG